MKKLKLLFCRHKNETTIDKKARILNGIEKVQIITYSCPDCGKTFDKIVRW